MRHLLLVGLVVSSAAAGGCNTVTGRCDCNYNEAAALQPAAIGPNYPVVSHTAPASAAPTTAAPAEKMPAPSKAPMTDLPTLPAIPN